tara:strand:- start:1334 stop:1957 length:624 start_codon:yes stop_codon:yes gene_type:complete
MITFYINLDSAIERKKKFKDTDAIRWKATTKSEVSEFVDKKMISMYNFGREAHLARCACFLSHTKLLEHIVQEKLNDVLILEDDAVKIREVPTEYPDDSIFYVGGFIHNRRMMNNNRPDIQHKEGLNLVPQEYRMLGCLSYIIPRWTVALKLLNKIYEQKRYKAIDILLGNIGIKQYYQYPPSFIEEGCESQIKQKTKFMNEKYEWR